VRFAWIEEHRSTWPVAVQCDVLEVSRSGFYAWQTRPAGERSQRRELLRVEIGAIHREKRKDVYGSPRIHQELAARGRRCNVKTVARIMKEQGIRAKTARKFKVTTDSKHDRPVASNVLDRAFEQTGANQAWVSDITYIPTREGWLYLAAIEDLYTRKIVGWSMSERLTSRLVVDALEMAIERQLPGDGLLSHSDRGSQYASEHYQDLLNRNGIRCSMSRKGDCWDNAPMESFFATLKKELVHFEDYATRDEARQSLFEYIEMFYNRVRRHSALAYKSPAEFELVA
jgi:transposase InsO family protein